MEDKTIKSIIHVCQPDELNSSEQHLIAMAIEATKRSYARYSHFNVGAAILLANGMEMMGCNQENAAFSVTMCAERSAIFAAGAQYPEQPITTIAIAARNKDGLLDEPVTPCGSCRQAMIETEQRFHQKLRILLYGTKHVYAIDGIANLMPLSFTEDQL